VSDGKPKPLAEAIDAVIDQVLAGCDDPRARELKNEYDQAVKEVRQRFERWQTDALAERTLHHTKCGHTHEDAARLAQADVSSLTGPAVEEREQLIAHHWGLFLRRLQAVLDEADDEGTHFK
jgi:hypothetical protein